MLKSLSDINCMAGSEDELIKYITDKLSVDAIDVKTDNMKNLIVSRICDKRLPTVILSAHMDEPGFIITDITKDGYLKFDTIGEVRSSDIISKNIKINDSTGIISLKAIHLTTKEEREKAVKISDLFIDIGAATKEEAYKVVKPGDYCYFSSMYSNFGEGFVKGKALSSRVSCRVLIDIINNNKFSNLNLICIFTSQKEIASRGARVALNNIVNSDLAIIIDSYDIEGNIKPSNGIVVGYRSDDNLLTRQMIKTFEDVALKKNVNIQKACCDKIKADLSAYKTYRADIPSTMIAVPCKYKNSATEVISKSDVNALYDLLYIFLSEVNNGTIL